MKPAQISIAAADIEGDQFVPLYPDPDAVRLSLDITLNLGLLIMPPFSQW
jgi:hypothetical protein